MKHLNPEQQSAVLATEGRVLVLAGAGSGKTSVLIQRCLHLIQEKKISPTAILGLTFTNKAAEEMRERIAKAIGNKIATEINLCTFHSFCHSLLRKEIHRLGYTNQFSLYDENDVKRVIRQLAKQTLDHEGELPSLSKTYAGVQAYKSNSQKEKAKWHDEFVETIALELETSMKAYNAVDFDGLLTLTVRLFEEYPDILQAYQKQYQYVMIDEYQDTNQIQFRLASLLCNHHNNLFVVGDDDQSIYGWRGSQVEHILNFDHQTLVKLEQNYRSTGHILNAASHVIQNNQNRHEKRLWCDASKGSPIEVFHAPSEQDEADAVVQRILALKKSHHLVWSDFAILYRSNHLSRPFELALMKASYREKEAWLRGIPYQVIQGTEFYERSEVKDVLAYMKVVANPKDQESLLRIINTPRRGISSTTLNLLTEYNRVEKVSLWQVLQQIPIKLTDQGEKGVKRFVELIKTAQKKCLNLSLKEAFSWLIKEIDYQKTIHDEVVSDKMRTFKWENVQSCLNMLAEYETQEDNPTIQGFLSSVLLEQNKQKFRSESGGNRVNLLTFHSSKGLEFPACFLVGLEDHILPHEKSMAQTGIEEERRLFYVAITRAQKYLSMSMSKARTRYGKQTPSSPSRFMFELPKESLKMSDWRSLGSFTEN